ncbi:hypothetical protein GCM10028819_33500 [Spirosoma humi]
MDALATLSFLPLRLSRNQITYTIDAAPDSISSRADLVYYLCIKKPKAPGSGEYEELITIPARELPKRTELGADIYPGASFDVAVFLDDYLSRTIPAPDQEGITACTGQVTPYLANVYVKNAGVLVAGSDKTLALEYALKGSLSVDEFTGWKDQFFTQYLATSRQFLTWQPAEKWVETNQPEFLYYLVNFTPKPAELWLRAEVTYTDGSAETLTLFKMTDVSQYGVYSMPVGFTSSGIVGRETITGKQVMSYQVWVSNESAQRLSEIRTYWVNRDYEPNTCFLLFANSLGGYDTLRCTGASGRTLTVTGTSAQRVLAPDYLPTSAELFSRDRRGAKILTVNTGLLDGELLDYLSELTLTEEIYVAVQEGFVALVPYDASLNLRADDEDLAGRTLAFQYAKSEVGYSALPSAPTVARRPTQWVPANNYCLINENGVRTGYMAAAKLELRYSDDFTLVKPRRSKANTPGTLGYTAPALSGVCNTTPFLNTLITKSGSYRRNNCGADQEPTTATLTIPAGTYGAETADQLQSRIDSALSVMDTQEYANQYGSCLLNPALYAYTVPANRWHYRSNLPARIGIVTADPEFMGNDWSMQGNTGSFIFPQGSNDLNFPSVGYNGYQWRIKSYGTPYQAARMRIYVNGVMFRDYTYNFNRDGYDYQSFFGTTPNGADGYVPISALDKIYVQLTDL